MTLLSRLMMGARLATLLAATVPAVAQMPATQPAAAGGHDAIRVIRFIEGQWDPSQWTAIRQPNQDQPRTFAQNADSIGVTLQSFQPDDYAKERDNAILVLDTGTNEGQVEVTFKAGPGFGKNATSGIMVSPAIVDGVAVKSMGFFVAPYGLVGWFYTPGDAAKPVRYQFVGQLGASFDLEQKHVLRYRFSKKRKAMALQVDDSDVLVVKYVGHPTVGAFDLEINSKIGLWGCHGVCDFYEVKILENGNLPFDWPGK